MNYLNWKFERSSGYAGWRCTKCGIWIYQDTPFNCCCGKACAFCGTPSESMGTAQINSELYPICEYCSCITINMLPLEGSKPLVFVK